VHLQAGKERLVCSLWKCCILQVVYSSLVSAIAGWWDSRITLNFLTKTDSVLSSKSCLFPRHSALHHSATSPSFTEYLFSSQMFQPVPSYLINLLMLPPSFPVASLLFPYLEVAIPQGREADAFFSLYRDALQGDEPALSKLSWCESVGWLLLLHAGVVGEPCCTRGGPELAMTLGTCRKPELGQEPLQGWHPGSGHSDVPVQPYCSSLAWRWTCPLG